MSGPGAAPGPVAVVIPTLNRIDDLRRCLAAARGQTRPPDLVVVVDNGSSDGTREELLGAGDVRALLPPANLGAPGGFAAGMREAFDAGAAWVWLLDDDAVPDPDALELLLGAVAAFGDGRVGGAVPTVEFGDGRRETGWLWGRRAARGHGQSPNVPDGGDGTRARDVDWAPFAGLLLAREACEEVGPVRADFVLWHADVEYCLRLRGAGWRLPAAPRAVVRHPAMPMISRRVLGKAVTVGDITPWREYYDVRNRVLLRRALRGGPHDAPPPLLRRVTEEAARDLAVLAADPAGAHRLLWRAIGMLDGLRGHMGRHPELRD